MFQDFFPGSIHSRMGCKDAAIKIPSVLEMREPVADAIFGELTSPSPTTASLSNTLRTVIRQPRRRRDDLRIFHGPLLHTRSFRLSEPAFRN